MNRLTYAVTLAVPLLFAVSASASEFDYEYQQDNAGPSMTTWFVSADPAAIKADRDYVAGMRPHHAGALSMSRDYLADPASSSPVLRVLAQAIIRNQTFEIAQLDEVARNLALPPVTVNLGIVRFSMRPAATEGLAHWRRFLRSPMPTQLDALSDPGKRVTRRDVAFAKAMMLHHQAAVDMSRAYLANSDARNGYLGLMNIDIERDQRQEIWLMQSIVAQYPDAASVQVDPGMVHGMEGMQHGGAMPPPAAMDHGAMGHAHH